MRLLAAAAALATLIATSPVAAQDRTGIRDCDDLMQWYAACARSFVPPQALPVFQAVFDQMRAGWRSTADNSDGRAAMARSCRDFGGAMRQQLAGFGCRP